MDPLSVVLLASSVVSALKGKKSIGFQDAALLQQLVDGVKDLFANGTRTCVQKTHQCVFREGSCHVLLEKGEDWQIEDIEACVYRKKIEN